MINVGHRRYVAVLLPFDKSFKVDEQAYRRYVRYFADDPRFVREGGSASIRKPAKFSI